MGVGDLFGTSEVEIDDDLIDFRTSNLAPARLSANGLKKVVRAEQHAKFTKLLLTELQDNFVPAFPRLEGTLDQEFALALRERFNEWRRKAEEKEEMLREEEKAQEAEEAKAQAAKEAK